MRIPRGFIVQLSFIFNTIILIFTISYLFSFNYSNFTQEKDGNRTRNFPCKDIIEKSHLGQRGEYWVLYSYIKRSQTFACDESITYTTPGDMTFLDKLLPLLERWHGPISVALYSPSTDFNATLERIYYLRQCASPLVKQLVSFHLFFDRDHIPINSTKTFDKELPLAVEPTIDCENKLSFGEDIPSFKKENKLLYPINVARNIAREMATTEYILAADIELYPNPHLIPRFLDMIKRNRWELKRKKPKVFVLPHFEVEANVTRLPETKDELEEMLRNDIAVPFHKFSCSACHSIPRINKWRNMRMTEDLGIFHVGKRLKAQKFWEPFYIGTKMEPMFDERLTWEGRANKMTQNYIMCLLDYEYMILDNAFLVHSPGIKRTAIVPSKTPVVQRQYKMISTTIVPEIHKLYGKRDGCYVLA